jgi:hypothetical protein
VKTKKPALPVVPLPNRPEEVEAATKPAADPAQHRPIFEKIVAGLNGCVDGFETKNEITKSLGGVRFMEGSLELAQVYGESFEGAVVPDGVLDLIKPEYRILALIGAIAAVKEKYGDQ